MNHKEEIIKILNKIDENQWGRFLEYLYCFINSAKKRGWFCIDESEG